MKDRRLENDKYIQLIFLSKRVDSLFRQSKKVKRQLAVLGPKVHREYEKFLANEPIRKALMEDEGI